MPETQDRSIGREVTQATPPAPEQARESVAIDVETVKEAARR